MDRFSKMTKLDEFRYHVLLARREPGSSIVMSAEEGQSILDEIDDPPAVAARMPRPIPPTQTWDIKTDSNVAKASIDHAPDIKNMVPVCKESLLTDRPVGALDAG